MSMSPCVAELAPDMAPEPAVRQSISPAKAVRDWLSALTDGVPAIAHDGASRQEAQSPAFTQNRPGPLCLYEETRLGVTRSTHRSSPRCISPRHGLASPTTAFFPTVTRWNNASAPVAAAKTAKPVAATKTATSGKRLVAPQPLRDMVPGKPLDRPVRSASVAPPPRYASPLRRTARSASVVPADRRSTPARCQSPGVYHRTTSKAARSSRLPAVKPVSSESSTAMARPKSARAASMRSMTSSPASTPQSVRTFGCAPRSNFSPGRNPRVPLTAAARTGANGLGPGVTQAKFRAPRPAAQSQTQTSFADSRRRPSSAPLQSHSPRQFEWPSAMSRQWDSSSKLSVATRASTATTRTAKTTRLGCALVTTHADFVILVGVKSRHHD